MNDLIFYRKREPKALAMSVCTYDPCSSSSKRNPLPQIYTLAKGVGDISAGMLPWKYWKIIFSLKTPAAESSGPVTE